MYFLHVFLENRMKKKLKNETKVIFHVKCCTGKMRFFFVMLNIKVGEVFIAVGVHLTAGF